MAMRTGIIAQKIGMTRRFSKDGAHIPITVLKMDNVQVVLQRTMKKSRRRTNQRIQQATRQRACIFK